MEGRRGKLWFVNHLEAEGQYHGEGSKIIRPLLSYWGFKNLQGELESISKVALEIRATEFSLLVYKVQDAILVPLTSADSVIIHFYPVISHCKILLRLKETNISCYLDKASGLAPEKQNQGKRKIGEIEEPYRNIKRLRYQRGITDPPSNFSLSTNSPRNNFIREPFIYSPNYWVNIHRLLYCAQGWAGLCGGGDVSGFLGLTLLRELQAYYFEAPRPLLHLGSRRRSAQIHCVASPED